MNDATTKPKASPLPFIVGGGFVALFLTAGAWQLDRRGEKLDLEAAFAAATGYTSFASGNEVRPFERLEVRGRYLSDRQIVLDNMIVGGRVGHFILTPLDVAAARAVRGRVGRLPRPGYRMGAAIPEVTSWPVHAVYPVYEDLEITLGRAVQPFVLLLDADDPDGWVREWQPDGVGPGRHLAYAVQWFAMALVLSGLLVMHARKRSFDND